MSSITTHQFQLTSTDGLRIACARWSNRKPPRGLLQIVHGMGEHIGRYQTFIEELVHAGLVVYGNDHRGHGRTARSRGELGDFGPGGFDLMVKDMVRLSLRARDENPNQPLILLGHGMGSFAAQQYVLKHSDLIDGLVLSGSGTLDGLARLARSAQLGENFLNASFVPARTPFDWLSRDPDVADAFMRDPFYFGTLQPASMQSFLSAAPQLANSPFARYGAHCPFTSFPAAKTPWASNWRALGSSWVAIVAQASRTSRIISILAGGMRC